MVKLKSILIKGFKEESRDVSINFSNEPVTVIYGENGSGKTTLLKIIHAIFSKNEQYLIDENIREITLVYLNSEKEKKQIDIKVVDGYVDFGENIEDITGQTSILFGVNRGVTQDSSNFLFDFPLSDLVGILKRARADVRTERSFDDLNYLIKSLPNPIFNDSWHKGNHILVDSISIQEIGTAIIKQFRAGQRATSDKVKNAFLNTISKAVDIELEQEQNYDLPPDFQERIEAKRDVLVSLVEKLDKSSLQLKLVNSLKKNGEINSEIQSSKIFRALLVNILEKAEEDNLELTSINQLIAVFNDHLYRNKKLIVTEEEAYIELSKDKKHGLDKLSSGERHLLTFLTLFLIIGRDRNFFIIDEPEISLNMKWQRELMPLLSKINPNAQIIVATHSPSIANRNSNYLVKLI